MKTKMICIALLCSLSLASCGRAAETPTPISVAAGPTPTARPRPTATPEPEPMQTLEPDPTATTEPKPTAEPSTPEARTATQEPPVVELVPFTSETHGISGIVPAGWDEIAPGVYNRGTAPTDLVRLIQQAAPNTTVEQIRATLLTQLGIDALPSSVDSYETAALTWDLYVIEVSAPDAGQVMVDLALAETDGATYLLLLQALPQEYEELHAAVFTPAVEALVVLAERDTEGLYADSDGLFTVPIPTSWTVETLDGYATLTSPDGEVSAHVLAVPADDLLAGIRDAWAIVDPTFDLEADEVIDEPVTNGVERAVTVTYDTGDEGPIILAGGWQHDGIAYVEIFVAELEPFQRRYYQLQIISTGYDILALDETDLSDVEPLPLSGELIAELEEYIVASMEQLSVPGAAVAIVHDGELVYANGFGVQDLETQEPVTSETLMMIGSTTKSMTTLLMAQLVDQGLFTWDTPVVDILPAFAVADPEVTEQITMRNLVCACTGVPRRDLEWVFNADALDAEAIIESLADFEFFTDFGEAFQYSNQMVATAGYLAALAAGGAYGELYDAYVDLMQENVLDPIDMASSTFSFEDVLANENYATPYAQTPLGETVALAMSTEAILVPIGPAGALWSNVLDMANYLITDLNQGIAPDGSRVVSTENLAVTWEPQVDITADASYGLGWIVEDYHGVLVLSHGGNTFGFTSELAFLPKANLGISILTNQRSSAFNQVLRFRLLELIFDRESEIEGQLQFMLDAVQESRVELRKSLQGSIDPEPIEPYIGAYANDVLGDVTLVWQDSSLVLDVGEFQAEIHSLSGDDGEIIYRTMTPPVEGVPVEFSTDDAGAPVIIFGVGVVEYTFEKIE